ASVHAVSPLAGPTPGGTTVTLAGSGMEPGALVFFGGRPASGVQKVVAGLTAITPASPQGVVDVAVTNPDDGRSAVARNAYNFYVGGPVVSHVEPNFGPPAGGTAVTITGRNFKSGVIISFA